MVTTVSSEVSFDPERHLATVQSLTESFEGLEDSPAKEIAEQLIAAIVELYGQGLERIVQTLGGAGAPGEEIRDRIADDGVVASLLLIHDLYPIDIETRVLEALASVRPYMESHGGDIEFLGIKDGVAHLRLEGHCKGCPASAATLELAIKEAIEEAAPDLAGLEVEGVVETVPNVPKLNGIPLTMVNAGGPSPPPSPAPTWMPLDAAGAVEPGHLETVSLRGAEIVVANIDGTLLAYRNACAGCDASLSEARLDGGILVCKSCDRAFDLPLAGRAVEDELQLEPIPLLRGAGTEVKVALAS